MIRLLRIAVTALFALTLLIFSFFYVRQVIKTDKTYPEIKMDKEVIEVRNDKNVKALLAGVSASDKKDGDLTDKIIIESISKFIENGTSKITYAVCDSDNHVSTATRKVKYVGYTSPKFYMNGSFCYSLYDKISINEIIGATDVIDGDISSNIITTSTDFVNGKVGLYTLKAKVTNSKGDTSETEFPLIIEDRSINAPAITLSRYLIYVKKGQTVNFRKYFKSALDSYEKDVANTLRIDSKFNKNKEGVYTVHYYVKDSLEREGHAVLTVVVT